MNVDPVYASIGEIFKGRPLFRVPKYQRSYAWEKQEIEDFINDIENCFNKRKHGSPINHFFGGIVSVEHSIPGTINQKEFELVDGQQRTATFVILASVLIEIYKSILSEVQASNDAQNVSIVNRRIIGLTNQFIEFEQEKNRRTETVDVLVLSKADEIVFRNVIKQISYTKSRDSHEKIEFAYKRMREKILQLIGNGTVIDRIDNLEIIEDIINADLSVIHIKTGDKYEAYTLFRVLNDRGKNLSDGDLLRARILELVEGHVSIQRAIESLWDDILSDSPSVTEEYLRAIYTSYKGVRPGANSLYDDFLNVFFPQSAVNRSLNSTEAAAVNQTTLQLSEDIKTCRILSKGEWPYQSISRPLTQWDTNRLTILIRDLRLTITIPVLLSASKLNDAKFSEIVQILERFLFRYKIIGNQHIGSATSIMLSEGLLMRQNPSTYSSASLRTALHTLQLSKVSDSNFQLLISQLEYKVGAGNGTIKYLLMTIEHYFRWYLDGANGNPTCKDKTRIYDFASTTIEHIYPRNAKSADIDNSLEDVKNNISNLTIMGPTDNLTGANDAYPLKRPIFQASSVLINQEIGKQTTWTINEVNMRRDTLKDIAAKIFDI